MPWMAPISAPSIHFQQVDTGQFRAFGHLVEGDAGNTRGAAVAGGSDAVGLPGRRSHDGHGSAAAGDRRVQRLDIAELVQLPEETQAAECDGMRLDSNDSSLRPHGSGKSDGIFALPRAHTENDIAGAGLLSVTPMVERFRGATAYLIGPAAKDGRMIGQGRSVYKRIHRLCR
jgi:hypothetical protein